jgi:glycosyltransferase involved in cell wall biosynthesis
MIEVVHIITTISRGGAEKQLLTLAKEQMRSGRKVSVIYLKGSPDLISEFKNNRIEVINFLSNKNPIIQLLMLKKYLRNKNVLLHAHLPRAELFTAVCKNDNFLIISKHNSERFYPNGPKIISFLIAKYVYKKSDQCIFISKAVYKYLKKINEVPEKYKNNIVYYGIEPNNKLENNYSLKPNIRKIGTVARIVPQKDFPTLIDAFILVNQEFPRTQLVVAGVGKEKENIIQIVGYFDIRNKIHWLGKIDNISKVFKQMDLFILSSKYEGFGLVLLEAMQNKIPILAANNSSIPEVMGKNYQGFFKTSNSKSLFKKICEAQDISFRKKLISRYDERLHFFDSTKMRQNIDLVYGKIAAE